MFFLKKIMEYPLPFSVVHVSVDAEHIDQGRGEAFIANTQTELLHRY